MKILTKDQILQVQDLKKEKVEVPEWGGAVWVRAMTAYEKGRFEKSIGAGTDAPINVEGLREKMLANCICDEKGSLLFTEKDIGALGKKAALPMDRLFMVAQRLCGFTSDDVRAMAKKSKPGRAGGSPSA